MFNKIIEFSVNNRLFVILGVVALIVFGIRSFQTLPIDAVPDITNTQVQINTPIKGLAPEEIERMVTFPIEYSMNGIPGVKNIRSLSRYGISQVTVIFKEGFDIYKARQLVQEQLQNLDLPPDITPQMGPISTGLGEIYHYSLEAKNIAKDPEKRLRQLMELRSLQDWLIKPRILTVDGITAVNTIGGYRKKFFIQPKINKMSKYGLHFDDIEKAVQKTNINVGGGYIQQTGEQLLVRGVGLLKTIKDIEEVIVKRLPNLEVIRVKDIADVQLDKEIRRGGATLNGEETILGTAFMLLGENSRAVSQRVDKKVEHIRKDLPEDIVLKTLYDRSNMVNATLGTVEHNLLFGATLVIVFLLLLLGNVRAAVITSMIIPLSMLSTFILMKWQSVSGNLMSLGALDFGIIVDGAVIVVENCVHKINMKTKELGRDLSKFEVKEEVKHASIEIRKAASFGQLIVIVVFIPLFALTGVEGKMFQPLALTFIMALISAFVLSFTVVPALAASFLSGKKQEKTPYLMRLIESVFNPLFRLAQNGKKIVMGIGVVAIAGGFWLFSQMGAEFIPQLNEGDFAVQMIRPANISIDSSLQLQKLSEKVIKGFPQVSHVFARTGAAEVATDPMGVNISDAYVMLKDKEKWPKESPIQTKQELEDAVKRDLELKVPGQVLMMTQPVELRFNELLQGTKSSVSAKIYGEDLDKLIRLSKEAASIISEIPGSGEVESQFKGTSPMIQYTPKKETLASLGRTSLPVLESISTALGGKQAGNIYEGVKKYPMTIRLNEKERKDLETVKNLPVGIGKGYTVPIDELAEINFTKTFTTISRENSKRRIAVLINPKTRDVQTFVEKSKIKLRKELNLPDGYYIEWGGSFKNLINAKKRLSVLVPIALLIILSMLYAAFRRFTQVIMIFLCVPFALIGGVVSMNIMSLPFSISAGIGFIALTGISILNGVVLMTYFNRLFEQGLSPDEIVEQGAKSRLRPVMMTALTDICGFLPMMFAVGLGAEVQRPVATVVVGGMISSTILTLIVVPAMYRLFFKYVKPVETQ